tara:strand:- start:2145 stop:3341 length:1197 start_codon:yes stop_codon:yes gene_type:complete
VGEGHIVQVDLTLPKAHIGQRKVIDEAARWNVVCCGRRFGKTTLGQILAAEELLRGGRVGWFAPTYRFSSESFRFFDSTLRPAATACNRSEMRIELLTGGVLDVWSLDNPDSGRGRKYSLVIIDEAGIVRDLEDAWNGTIRPTLTDYRGKAWLLGTPKGRGYFFRLFAKGEAGDTDWKAWRLPTLANPFMPPEEVAAAKRDLPAQVFAQEYEGVPADDGGCPFSIKAIGECTQPMSDQPPVVWGVDLAKSQDWTVAVALDDEGRVCRLERWQGSWRNTEERLSELIGETYALVDSTGVGDPVVETLQSTCPAVEGFKFTMHSKQQIMEGLSVAIQTGAVAFPDGWLRRELESFEFHYTRTGVRYEAPSGAHDDGVCALALAHHARSNAMANRFTFKVI